MKDGVKLSEKEFEERCSSLKGRLTKSDDRMFCEVDAGGTKLRFVRYPDGVVIIDNLDKIVDIVGEFMLE